MLFHSLYDEQSRAYFEQASLRSMDSLTWSVSRKVWMLF
ncbi:hypothetical protein KQR57_22335 [Bacillus inaquosorum]|nr:hypothetical protein [Bacillus inaquosorum]